MRRDQIKIGDRIDTARRKAMRVVSLPDAAGWIDCITLAGARISVSIADVRHVTMAPPIVVGERVIFSDPPSCFEDLRGVAFTVENVAYGVGGMMDQQTRDEIAAGHAKLIMVADGGRRIGTTDAHVTRIRN